MQSLLRNAALVLPDRLIPDGWLLVEGERILDLGAAATCPANATTILDLQGDFLMPGVIDLHSDAIEKVVQPRPNVEIDLPIALHELDWRLAGSGVTTEFHAISLDDHEFGIRTDRFAGQLGAAIHAVSDLLVRHRVHARFEITSDRGEAAVADMMRRDEAQLVSLMDHSPGQGQYATEDAFRDYVASLTGRSATEIDALITFKRAQSAGNMGRIQRITALARERGIALATHDDDEPAKVEQWPALGISIAEFPTRLAAAQRAHELGLAVCMGAPNVLRGRSSGGNVSALEALAAGVVDALCSDYYPAAMLAAAFKVANQGVCTLPAAIRLITANPARAVGLADFGELRPGAMADLIQVRQHHPAEQTVRAVWIAGSLRVRRG